MKLYEENKIPIAKLFTSIEQFIDKNVFDNYFMQFEKADNWKKSQLRIILQIHERILLTDELNREIKKENIISIIEYPKLIVYLRLTCFDALGQANDWVDFNGWLSSKKDIHKKERNKAILKINNDDNIEFTKQLHKEYQLIYGVKNSFFNFIRDILPVKYQDKLFDTIKYSGNNDTLSNEELIIKKRQSLFKLRNEFTHNIYSTVNIPYLIDSKSDFTPIEPDVRKGGALIHKNFFDVLRETILVGISEYIKNKTQIVR